MLKLMLDADRLRSSDALIARICERAEAGVRGQILIVPEQYSHAAERALCAAGGDTISRYAEVLSFTRLASRMFSLYGGVCEEYLDKRVSCGGAGAPPAQILRRREHENGVFAAARCGDGGVFKLLPAAGGAARGGAARERAVRAEAGGAGDPV